MPLDHPFRTEGHLHRAAASTKVLVDPIGGAGKHGGSQHDQLAVGELRQQRVEALLDGRDGRVGELVDRRSDGHDDRAAARDVADVAGEEQLAVSQATLQQRFRSDLHGGQPAVPKHVQRLRVDIVDKNSQTFPSERERQRKACVPGSAYHSDVDQGPGVDLAPGGISVGHGDSSPMR